MAEILQNEQVSDDFYLMKVKKKIRLQWGSFICYVMEEYPVLSRPISVFDAGPGDSQLFV